MTPTSLVTALARRWTSTYTLGLPAAVRDRRREEIAEDLWEQQHDEDGRGGSHRSATGLATRVLLGIPADLLWRAGERRPIRRLELANFAIDRTWERRMRSLGRAAVLGAIALFVPVAVGVPLLLVVTLPASALATYQLARRDDPEEHVINTAISRQRRIRFRVFAVAVVVFVVSVPINALPSQQTHDRYWILLVTPMMVGFMVGVVALLMLVWSLIPRRDPLDG